MTPKKAAANLRELAEAWAIEVERDGYYPLEWLDARELSGAGYQTWYTTLTGMNAYGENTPGECSFGWTAVCGFSPEEHSLFWCFLADAVEAGDFK